MKDDLSTRMKEYYENRTRITLPRRTYTIIRIDGKAFHTFTKGLKRPFDEGLMTDMNETAEYLCKNIQGAKFAFVQSDEISILVTDFELLTTDAWFDGNIQKIVSVSASMATSKFNQLRWCRFVSEKYNNSVEQVGWAWFIEAGNLKLAEFDSRTFTIPSKTEVMNYFIWRQIDTVRNSISSAAQSVFSHKELNNKNTDMMQEMLFQKGINWNNYTPQQKRGRFIFKKEFELETEFVSVDKKQTTFMRSRWVTDDCPTFTQDKNFLAERIPDL